MELTELYTALTHNRSAMKRETFPVRWVVVGGSSDPTARRVEEAALDSRTSLTKGSEREPVRVRVSALGGGKEGESTIMLFRTAGSGGICG